MEKVKWKGPYENIVATDAKIYHPPVFVPVKPPGCFIFNDGTTLNWSIDQLYGWLKGPNYDPVNNPDDLVRAKISPFTQYLPWNGFNLGNYMNLALSAEVGKLFILDPDVVKCSFYFESPDLNSNPQWQNAKGYNLDIHRLFFSSYLAVGNPPSKVFYSVQLQAKITKIDTATGQIINDPSTNLPYFLYAEWDNANQKFVDHAVDYDKNYNLTFKPSILENPPAGEATKIHKVRIRCTMMGYLGKGQGEVTGGGQWLIGNVCPEL